MHIDNVDLEHFPANEVAQRLLTYVTRGWISRTSENGFLRSWV